MKQYNEIRSALGGCRISAVRYEDIMKSPEQFISAVFQFCGLPDELVSPALRAMNTDSQENSCLSRRELYKHRACVFGPDVIARCNSMCFREGFPAITEEYVADGVITNF